MKNTIFVLFLFFLISCQKEVHNDSVVLNHDSFLAIKSYMSKHKYRAYLLLSTKELFNDKKEYSGYLIGPLYKKVLAERTKTKLLQIDGENVYILSDLSDFLKQDIIPQDFNSCDSVILYNKDDYIVYTHDALINYLKRANLLFYRNGIMYTNFKPDTLYLPKMKTGKELNDDI